MRTYVITAFADDTMLWKCMTAKPLAWVLVRAAAKVGGTPQAWVGIRCGGRLVAEIQTNWRGEIEEVSVHSPISSLVSSINPAWLTRKAKEVPNAV